MCVGGDVIHFAVHVNYHQVILHCRDATASWTGGSIFHKVIFGGNEDSFQPD
jgi:hypothetical protein